MYVWSGCHDRPMCWAADRANDHGPFRPKRLPSRSQFCRRIATPRGEALMQAVEEKRIPRSEGPGVSLLDGRALTVGPYTHDADAGKGFVRGGFAWGYKMHALNGLNGAVSAWKVTPLNGSEKKVAFELIDQARPRGRVLADGNYDIGALYDHP